MALAGSLCAICLATTLGQNLTFLPAAEYELGPTEPQADWAGAFRWVNRQSGPPVTIMALPVFHDLYAGPDRGEKYFLPFTMTRVPGDWKESASYVAAKPVSTLKMLKQLDGYVVLDAFSFFSLKDRGIQRFLEGLPPAHVTSDGTVRIWRIDSAQDASRQDALQ